MKLFVISFVIFTATALIDSASLTPANYESGNECKTVELESDYYSSDETRLRKSIEESPCQGNDRSGCPEGIADETPLARPQQSGLEILENVPMTPNYFYGMPSQKTFDWATPWQRPEYQFNTLPEFRGIPYSGVQYYVQPSQYSQYNPFPARLPPAVPTYARRSIPELHREVFRRPARVIRSREEDDFLAELQHMAIMNNILPTMPIPFMRSAYNDYVPYDASRAGEATAVFPASASGCAVPLLFSCTPKITRGIVGKPLPPDYSQLVPPAAPAYEYRKQELNKEDSTEVKSNLSHSDVNSNDDLELSGDNHSGNDNKAPAMNAIDRALQPKHVGSEKHAASDKTHVKSVLPAHMTS